MTFTVCDTRKDTQQTHPKYPLIALASVFVSYSMSSLKSNVIFFSVKNRSDGNQCSTRSKHYKRPPTHTLRTLVEMISIPKQLCIPMASLISLLDLARVPGFLYRPTSSKPGQMIRTTEAKYRNWNNRPLLHFLLSRPPYLCPLLYQCTSQRTSVPHP